MIQMYHVTKHYERADLPALADVNLRVAKGEWCFLTGPSGAGKTTLLKLIFVAERAGRGQVIINGHNIARMTKRGIPYLRRNIGVVFQDFKLLGNRSVFENVAFAMYAIGGFQRREVYRRVNNLLKMVGLQHKANTLPIKLSGGEQQRVAIARALINQPAILLADEPTGNLDPGMSIEMMKLFDSINARGTTVLLATHDPYLIERHPRRVLSLERGKLVSS